MTIQDEPVVQHSSAHLTLKQLLEMTSDVESHVNHCPPSNNKRLQYTNLLFIFRPGSTDPSASPTIIVTLDLGSSGFNQYDNLRNKMREALDRGRIGAYSTSHRGFTFRPLTGMIIVSITRFLTSHL